MGLAVCLLASARMKGPEGGFSPLSCIAVLLLQATAKGIGHIQESQAVTPQNQQEACSCSHVQSGLQMRHAVQPLCEILVSCTPGHQSIKAAVPHTVAASSCFQIPS